MSVFYHPADLSAWPAVQAIEAEYALVGYARYLKALEALAGAGGVASMTREAWAALLACQPDQLDDFLGCCWRHEALELVDDDGEALTIACAALELHIPGPPPEAPPPNDDTLFLRPEQWAEWFIEDLGFPPALANDPAQLRMYARWCASRVTVGDMAEAVQRTVAHGTGINVSALHGHLKALRAQRIEEAGKCY